MRAEEEEEEEAVQILLPLGEQKAATRRGNYVNVWQVEYFFVQ